MFAAEEVSVTLKDGVYDTDHITWSVLSGKIQISQNKGKSNTTVNSNYISSPRIYKGHVLAFTCAENYTITQIDITYNGTYLGTNFAVNKTCIGDTLVNDDQANFPRTLATVSGGTHVFKTAEADGESVIYIQSDQGTASKYTQLRPTAIKITYIKTASTKPTITCGDVNFGIVNAAATNSKEVVVEGENLTENITAALKFGTNFSVSGALTNAGGTLTVDVIAKTEGAVEDTLILSSGTTTTKVAVSADVIVLNGAGTKENPYTISDVKKLQSPGTVAWVVGYIVGSIDNNKVEATPSIATNIALSDTKTLTKDSIFTPVQLPTGDIRTALNVVDNAKNIGKQVKVYGSLETYFNMPGVKSVTDYEFIGETAVENIESTSKAIKRYDAELGQVVIIRNGIKYNAIGVKLGTVAE